MKLFRRFAVLGVALAATSLCLMGASGGCGSDLHKAALAADSIASGLNTAATINHNVSVQGLESEQERIVIATAIDQAAQANDVFIAQLQQVKASGGQVTAETIVSAFSLLSGELTSLNQNGVLHLKSPQAQASFATIMASIQAELAIIQGLISKNSSSHGNPAGVPIASMAIALTAEEIELLIGFATAALGAGSGLVQKLLAMKGESDADLLADASTQDAAARKQAQQDEKPGESGT